MKGLEGKRAVVCGSTQGIGRAAALRLAEEGAEVILLSRNEDKLAHVCSQLPAKHGQHHRYVVADQQHPDKVLAALKEVIDASMPIHILINNTGGPASGPASEADLNAYAAAFTMHVLSGQAMVKALVPLMKSANYGRIVNVISTSVKQPIPNLGVSNTIRAAVANWAKTLSLELGGYGITVNNVLPGYTKTERLNSIIDNKSVAAGVPPKEMAERMMQGVPARRFGEAEEVAAAIAFLCSEEASYVNGINLPVDGGRTASL